MIAAGVVIVWSHACIIFMRKEPRAVLERDNHHLGREFQFLITLDCV